VAIKKFKINNGLGNDHPLNHVKFYDLRAQPCNAYYLEERKLESMLPKYNVIWCVRCFVRPDTQLKFDQAKEAFEQYCIKELGGEARQVHKENQEIE